MIIFVGVASSLFVLPPNLVTRSDGTIVKINTKTKVRDELIGMGRALKDWRLLALVPMFFASNYYNSYWGALNTAVFDGPTRALNATLGGAGEIFGSIFIGYCVLDAKWLRRRQRGYAGLALLSGIVITVWSVGLSWQVSFQRDYEDVHGRFINYKDPNYAGKGLLFFFCESSPRNACVVAYLRGV